MKSPIIEIVVFTQTHDNVTRLLWILRIEDTPEKSGVISGYSDETAAVREATVAATAAAQELGHGARIPVHIYRGGLDAGILSP
jgi:hypothetical protein